MDEIYDILFDEGYDIEIGEDLDAEAEKILSKYMEDKFESGLENVLPGVGNNDDFEPDLIGYKDMIYALNQKEREMYEQRHIENQSRKEELMRELFGEKEELRTARVM